MKKFLLLFTGIFLLYISVSNPNGFHISSIELLGTGYDRSDGKIQISNYILNLATMFIYLSMIESAIASRFRLGIYVSTRGGLKKLITSLIKAVMQTILAILLVKQITYILFYVRSSSYTDFYVFDMVSTLLTLSILGLLQIGMKLQGFTEKISLFSVLALTAIAQFLSYHYSIFSIIVIASAAWQENQLAIIAVKSIVILAITYTVYSFANPDKLLGAVKE